MPPKIMTIMLWDKPLWSYCTNNSLLKTILVGYTFVMMHERFIDPFRWVHVCFYFVEK